MQHQKRREQSSTDTGPAEPVNIGIGRATQIIMAVAASNEADMGVSQLARETGMSKAVVHRIVRTLVAHDFFQYNSDSQRYSLGSGALLVGLSALERLNVPEIASKHLEPLVTKTNETATLSVRSHHHRTYVRQELSPQEIHMSVRLGIQFPLHRGASSLAILSALDDDEVDQVLSEIQATGVDQTLDSQKVKDQVLMVRSRGFSKSRGERQLGAAAVASAIRMSDGSVWGSTSICGPAERFTEEALEKFASEIRQTATSISQDLGFRGSIY